MLFNSYQFIFGFLPAVCVSYFVVARFWGRRAGMASMLGVMTGCCVHTVLAALGISVLLAASATEQPEAGEQSLAGWWTRSQMSFHYGAGLDFLDTTARPQAEDRLRYKTSRC